MIRDKLLARLQDMGDAPDHQRLAAEVLGIRGAPPDLARRLVAQALVVEDRRDAWRRAGERICRDAPQTPGVYVLRDEAGRALYVGKAVNLRRRLRAHFAERRWRGLKAEMSRAAGVWAVVARTDRVFVARWPRRGGDAARFARRHDRSRAPVEALGTV